MQARASLLSPRAVCALALAAFSALLLGGCVTSTGSRAPAVVASPSYMDVADPVVQQRTDLFIRAFEEGCLDQQFDSVIKITKRLNGFGGQLAAGKWPESPVTLPKRKVGRYVLPDNPVAQWNYWDHERRRKYWAGFLGDGFGPKLRDAMLSGIPEYFECAIRMEDVDTGRINAAVAELTGALGVTHGSWRQSTSIEETRYYTGTLDIPLLLRVSSTSYAIDNPRYDMGKPLGFGGNEAGLWLIVGVPKRNFPPGSFGDLLRNANALATAEMRQHVNDYTGQLQGMLSADFNRRIQAKAARAAAARAEADRKEREFLAWYNKQHRSDAEVFADAMNQSANNMRRQQQAFDRIDRQVGGATTSQQRLNAAREAGRNGIIPGGSSGSGGSSSTSGSGGSGGSGSASSGGGLALCASTYVDPPAKYRDQMMTLSWGCNSRYKSAAEVNAVYSQLIDGIEKRDAAMQAAKDRQAALRKANRVDAPPAKNPCPENSGNCSVGKP